MIDKNKNEENIQRIIAENTSHVVSGSVLRYGSYQIVVLKVLEGLKAAIVRFV